MKELPQGRRGLFQLSSLRAKLILANLMISFLAILGMGVYIFFRAWQSNNYLTSQLNESVNQQAQEQLTNISTTQAIQLENFFRSFRQSVFSIGASLGDMLSESDTIGSGYYWNAPDKISQLPSGSWDNSNAEFSSIFIPGTATIDSQLTNELNTVIQLDFLIPPMLEKNPDIVAVYFGGENGETVYYPNVDLANILPPDFDVTGRPWYVNAIPPQNIIHEAVWSAPYLDAALNGLVITTSVPVYDGRGILRGVTAMDIQLNRITDLVTTIQVGETGYAFLIDRDQRLIALPEAGYRDLSITAEELPLGEILDKNSVSLTLPPEFWDVIASMAAGQNGLVVANIGGEDRFISFQNIPEVEYSIGIIVPTSELLSEAIIANQQISQVTRNTIVFSFLLIGAILLAALIATIGISNRLTKPLTILTRTAEEVSKGNLAVEARIDTKDEMGTLAQSFNAMTLRLREMIDNLETRVTERTKAMQRRANQVQAALEVGRAATSIRDMNELLPRITQLISQYFGFYHVGIFLLDEMGDYAVLMASNSTGGQAMLRRGHKLQVGQTGMVGFVTAKGEPRIALDVGEDNVFFNNPDLPQTRSEMTVPMILGGRIMGALDVQSTEEAAFSEEDTQTMRILADQISIAIENARLFDESQKAIESVRRAYGEIRSNSWKEILVSKKENLGYFSVTNGQVFAVSDDITDPARQAMLQGRPVLSNDQVTLNVPVQIQGNSVGVIDLRKQEKTKWTEAEIAIINSISDQLSSALESARLYDQILDRAQTEARITDITAKIGSSVEMDRIMRTTVEEIGRIFHGSEILLQLTTKDKNRSVGQDEKEI